MRFRLAQVRHVSRVHRKQAVTIEKTLQLVVVVDFWEGRALTEAFVGGEGDVLDRPEIYTKPAVLGANPGADGTFRHPPCKPRVSHPRLVICFAWLIGAGGGLVDAADGIFRQRARRERLPCVRPFAACRC